MNHATSKRIVITQACKKVCSTVPLPIGHHST
ncbi:hypothetical protein LINPERPRIM_LOCUS33448 [Linum perenne]